MSVFTTNLATINLKYLYDKGLLPKEAVVQSVSVGPVDEYTHFVEKRPRTAVMKLLNKGRGISLEYILDSSVEDPLPYRSRYPKNRAKFLTNKREVNISSLKATGTIPMD